jgi:hypothetical protein
MRLRDKYGSELAAADQSPVDPKRVIGILLDESAYINLPL